MRDELCHCKVQTETQTDTDQLDADVVVRVCTDDVQYDRVALARRHAERQRVTTPVDPLTVTICQCHHSATLGTERIRYAV